MVVPPWRSDVPFSVSRCNWRTKMISRSKRRTFALAAASAVTALAFGITQRAHAVTGSWTGAGADDSWGNPVNWDVIPGTTDGTFVSTDTAYFSGAPLLTTVTVDHNRNIGSILFDNSASSFTIGSSTGEALHLSNGGQIDRKSTRLNSSHMSISYAVFCLKK